VRRWWIAGLVAALAVVLFVYGAVRHFTGAEYLEKKLSTAIVSANGVNRVRIGSSDFRPLRGSLVARELEFLPDTLLLEQRTRAGTPPRTRYSVTASSLRVHGIRFWPLLHGRIVADSVAVDGFRADVYLDRRMAHAPRVKPATLPHVSFQRIGRPIRIDIIRVTNSGISYSETATDGSRPGTMRFTDLWATFYNVTNDSTRMTPSTPCTIDVRTRVAGAGRLDVTFGYYLLSTRLNMTYRGAVARMRAEPLNDLLVNLEGMRITDGVIDSTWFDIKVQEDVARGNVQVLYRDLDIEMLDKVSLDRGLGARLQTFIADKTVLNHANPPDDQTPAKVVPILRERTPETRLFKFLWGTLHEGILSTLGT
jgi:hypothetical protein